MIRPLDDLGQLAIGRHAGEDETALFQRLAIMGVHLVAVTMPLGDRRAAVDRSDMAVAVELGVIGAQPHRAAKIAASLALLQAVLGHPLGDETDDGLLCRAEFGGRGLLDAGGIPRALDAGHLHAEANAEERHAAFARKSHGGNLALRPTLAETARDEDTMHRLERRREIGFGALEQLGIEPADVDLHPVGDAAVDERLVQRLIGVLHAGIFADDADRHLAFRVVDAIGDIGPAAHVRRGSVGIDVEGSQHFGV